jgi:hypothetical protein
MLVLLRNELSLLVMMIPVSYDRREKNNWHFE